MTVVLPEFHLPAVDPFLLRNLYGVHVVGRVEFSRPCEASGLQDVQPVLAHLTNPTQR